MESAIDERYCLILVQDYLQGYEDRRNKAVFYSPVCQSNRPRDKYVQRKGAMFWIPQWNAWRFNCIKCLPMTGMYQYLMKVNPLLGKRYQRERYQSGTTGKGHDCPDPKELISVDLYS